MEVGELQVVPRRSAADFLKLAPGILLTNEGGEGHPEQIFLRGFDAREGQDLELTVDGVPINELGNLHGNGFSDLNFLIPELVENLRVLEGPFDPRQGNFAVAGSADRTSGRCDSRLQRLRFRLAAEHLGDGRRMGLGRRPEAHGVARQR
ncbi:MAG: Plug domain-containing protein, partial [Acidobacteria bacterium ACB2]|nr:Plug domain-containing protein [Acidobacteria bacterium ACB2]